MPALSDTTTRTLLTLLVVLAAVAAVALMRRGWRRRAQRQADLPAPSVVALPGTSAKPAAEPPSEATVRRGPVAGRYLATTASGDWLDRIVVHGLGVPSQAAITVRDDGILVERTGARDVFVPGEDLVEVQLGRAIAGAVYEEGGLLVLTWRLGDRVLDTGFRAGRVDEHAELVDAIAPLVGWDGRPGAEVGGAA
jgi:hypothetical protein